MGQELLDVGTYERPQRVFYLATTSTGYKFVRGSWIDKYSHAVVCSKSPHFRPKQLETYGSCHGRKDLAQRTFNRWSKNRVSEWEYELVELVKITAKEARAIKKQSKNEYEQWREEQRNATEGKETENN